MPTQEDLAELAKICARHARGATNKDVASALWKMAEDYRSEAAKLDSAIAGYWSAAYPFLGRFVGIGSITTYQFQTSRGLHRRVGAAGIWHGDCLDCRGSRTNSDYWLSHFSRNRATRRFQQPPPTRLSLFSLDRKPLTPFSLTSF